MTPQLATIHDAMNDAQTEIERPGEKLKPRSYTIEDSLYFRAKEICENNSTNLSSYLRKCCTKLVEDYVPNFEAR